MTKGIARLFEDDQVACCLAVVALHDGETSHWAVNDEGDVEVTVVTHNHAVPVTAVLGALVGGAGKGVWMVPPLGTEVVLAFEQGDFESDAVIVGVMPTGQGAPAGLADGKVVIVGVEVLIHNGDGTVDQLVTRSDFENHTHLTAGTGSPVGPTELTPSVPPGFKFTTVLKAK